MPSDRVLRGIFAPVTTPFRGDDPRPGRLRGEPPPLRDDAAGRRRSCSAATAKRRSLDDDESDALIEMARGVWPARKWLIAGTGRESTKATIAATRRAAARGADAVMVRTPSFYKTRIDGRGVGPFYTRRRRRVAGAGHPLQRHDLHRREPGARGHGGALVASEHHRHQGQRRRRHGDLRISWRLPPGLRRAGRIRRARCTRRWWSARPARRSGPADVAPGHLRGPAGRGRRRASRRGAAAAGAADADREVRGPACTAFLG